MTDKTMTREQAFAALAARNVAKAVVSFSGGNDEGGPDTIILRDAEGAEVGELYQAWMSSACGGKESEDAALAEALAQPVFDAYGTFCGDFDVSGEVIWTTAERTVRMERSERANYEYAEYEL